MQNITNATSKGFNFVVNFDNAVFNTAGDGYWSDVAKAVTVFKMGMYVGLLNDNEYYNDGDFYVNYDEATWDNDVDGLIYSDKLFRTYVRKALYKALIDMGIDDNTVLLAVNDLSYSEQGMQDYGRVSFDAYELANILRQYYNKTVLVAV